MEIPLQFHEFHPLNHEEKCPKFTETIQHIDVLQISDLDALYTDLENLQGAANIRLRRLEEEVKILSEWCDKKDRLKGELDLNYLTSSTTNKRTRSCQSENESKLSKKQKTEEPTKANVLKNKSKSKPTTDSSDNDTSVSRPKLTYEAPNKFWSYIEPYCSDILAEHITALEESLNSKSDASEYYKVPPLGKHYSEVWCKEDFLEEQQQNMKIEKKKTSSISSDEITERFINKTNSLHSEADEVCPYGSFTQKLIAALVDENIMAPVCESDLQNTFKAEEKQKNEIKIKKSLSNNYARSLEIAIKEELYSLGVIDSIHDEENEVDHDDEILLELRRLQSELKAVRSHNKLSINELASIAKVAMRKQEVRQKAKMLDAEVVDIFRRFSSSRSKKKGLSRKEREIAWKAYNDRKAIWEIVDNENDDSHF